MHTKAALSRQDLVRSFDALIQAGATLDRGVWTEVLRAEANYWSRQFAGPADVLEHLQASIRRNVGNLLPADASGKRVLDLGSGPFPLERDDVEIVAVDPLADEYRKMLESAGLHVSAEFITAVGETLSEAVSPGSFDYVLVSNSLDQCYDPTAFVAGCRAACRPGGTIILHCRNLWDPVNMMRGARNWNLILCCEDLILWRPGQAWSLRALMGPTSRFDITNRQDGTVTVRAVPAVEKRIKAPDYAEVYDAIYSGTATYTASHTSPGLRTALGQSDRILSAGPRHLDIGAGPGYLVEVLSMPPFRKESRGVDVSAVAVAMANQRLKPGLVTVMRAGEIPHPDDSFDLLTCFDVMEHLEPMDVQQLMREVRRVASPGAVGLFNISLRDSSLRDINGDSVHRSILSPSEWDALINFDSYRVIKRENELLGEIIF